MKGLAFVVALACAMLVGSGGQAVAQVALNDTPAVLSGGVGWYDFVQQDDEAGSFRLEYRHGEDFLWLKPWGGVEANWDGSVWGGVGVLFDITLFDSVVLTASFAPGLWAQGSGKDLGHVVEFRSQAELGYQFENQSRLSIGLSHTSNANLDSTNPGVEVLSLYYHLPLDAVF
jgi:hypothetical protein